MEWSQQCVSPPAHCFAFSFLSINNNKTASVAGSVVVNMQMKGIRGSTWKLNYKIGPRMADIIKDKHTYRTYGDSPSRCSLLIKIK